ncbi:hypothetical protein ACBY01_16060 [Sphingomonas sp. ac-8]|uniref:hypothetical protein n=1 Tax=Sphingomonas sp. ac-8 TaxID=3242977 RepID=UPI003A812C91
MRLLLFLSALLTGLTGALVGATPVEARQVEQVAGRIAAETVADAADHAPLVRHALATRGDLRFSPVPAPAAAPHVDVRSRVDSALE